MKSKKCIILKKTFWLLLFFVSLMVTMNGQTLKNKFLQADSILLISHKAPPQIINKTDNPNDYNLIVKGKLNKKIIKESKRLEPEAVQSICSILTRPFNDSIIEEVQCFIPHHAVLFFIKNKISFIDICFQCQEIVTSADIKIPNNDFDHLTWRELEFFFRQQGLTYELAIKSEKDNSK